ncbi:MAG: hypothetical protein Q8Q35_01540 [Nanoarchaeota archaeon]|nr:hypothetical protein [Nanoarchaeota archaeon]
MNKMDKKGAVELSMTTIIIIVIGITVLSLGLVWIRSIFSDVGGITDEAFSRGEAEIAQITGDVDEPLSVSPDNLDIEQGDTGDASITVNNLESDEYDVSLTVESVGGGDVACAFDDTFDTTSDTYTLSSGDQLSSLKVLVEDKGSDLGRYGCRIKVSGFPDDASVTLLVNIE